MILLDTNLLVRMTDSTDPQCAAARRAFHVLLAQGERLVIVPQNLYEFWAVATRKPGVPPAGQNGLGMTSTQASLWLRYFQRRFQLLTDRTDIVDHWHALVYTHGIQGLKSHDARLVAAMQLTASREYSRSTPTISRASLSPPLIRVRSDPTAY